MERRPLYDKSETGRYLWPERRDRKQAMGEKHRKQVQVNIRIKETENGCWSK